MKTVLCQHPEMDYLGSTVTIGMYEAGHEVSEIPYVRHLHNGVDDWYTLADGKRGMTGPPGFIADNPLPPNEKSEEEVLDTVKDADLIVCQSTRRYALEALDKIIARLGKTPKNLVICDGEDSWNIPVELLNKYKPAVFFKREMRSEHTLQEYSEYCPVPIWPLQFGAPIRNLPDVDDTDKKWDFVLTLGNTHEMRSRLLEACLQANIPNSYIGGDGNNPLRAKYPHMKDMVGWKEYMTMIAQSKITANCRGFGRDTLNFWERACWNTLIFYVPPGLHIPHPPRHVQHCIHFSERDFSDIGGIIPRALKKYDEIGSKIAANGKKHCHEFHSMKYRAEYLVNIATRILGGEKIDHAEFGL